MSLAKPGVWEKYLQRKYVGAPYKERGRTLAGGFDCWGLILSGYLDFDITLFDLAAAEYATNEQKDALLIEHWHHDWLPVAVPSFPDCILFHNQQGLATHAGIMFSGARFLHAMRGIGTALSRLSDPPFDKASHIYFRHNAFAC